LLLQLQRCSSGGVGGTRGDATVPAALQGRTATARNRPEEEEVLEWE